MRLISGAVRPTPTYWLPLLSNLYPPQVRRTGALVKESQRLQHNSNLSLHSDISTLRRNRLRSRKPPLWKAGQLVNNNVETVDLWKQNCELIEDPVVREWFEKYDCDTTDANLDRALWAKLNRIRSGYGQCADSLYKWGLTDSPGCECGAPRQTIKHIPAKCPLLSFQASWSDLMRPDEAVLDWIKNLDIDV
nr:unnamed protein product [Callosobruchus analis]